LEVSEEEYNVQVARESGMDIDDEHVTESNIVLTLDTQIISEKATLKCQFDQFSQVANIRPPLSQQRVSNEGSSLNQSAGPSVLNVQLNYNPDQALDPDSWDGNFHTVLLYGAMEHMPSDVLNFKEFLSRMCKYMLGKAIESDGANDIEDLNGMGKALWEFISAIYDSHWDNLFMDNNKMTFRNKVKLQFSPQVSKLKISLKGKETVKPTFVSSLPPLILAKSQKEVNEISKYFKKNTKASPSKSYAQASSSTKSSSSIPLSDATRDALKNKETFPNLPNSKIDLVQKVINGPSTKPKPRINMTTKGPSHKQIIIPMSIELSKKFIKDSSMYVININRALKEINSKTIVDFICVEDKGIVITTNNISSNSDLQEIKKYVKNSFSSEAEQISSPRLPQSKSYLKIVGIPYINDITNSHFSSDDVESILRSNHIFNDIVLASRPRIIKVSPKSDMSIIWIDIWDSQSSSNAKKIINRRFNVESFIATVRGANMNPGVPQCKNCWKWGHTAGVCHIQGAKCLKCNGPHLVEHYRHFTWYCKANDKINLPRLETKKSIPCPHSFKYINCKGNHQADSSDCPFWKHHFNKEWFTKEYAKFQESRNNSICSSVNGNDL